jgi:hypothetical protein
MGRNGKKEGKFKKRKGWVGPGVLVHIYNPSTLEAKAEDYKFKAVSKKKRVKR